MKVLLVEDNPGDVRLIREMLKEVGTAQFELGYVVRLGEALQRLGEEAFDVVLLDLGLPDSQGLDTLIRVQAQLPDVAIVVLTVLADETLGVKAVQQGAQDYLVKGQVDSNPLVRTMRYAIERKRAEKALRESEKRERYYRLLADNLTRDILDAQEAERERICLDVHDGVTQTLASAFQYLQTLETTSLEGTHGRQSLLRASALVKQAIQESREVINSLQPATLRDLGLVTTLRQEMRQLRKEMKWRVDFKADPIRLPRDIETGLYRIIREAITNARKHADTNRLRIRITSSDDRVKVEVRDWGAGFNYNHRDIERRRGGGLLSMRRRAELLQGACDIQSAPGVGTTVRVEIPLAITGGS